MLTCMKAMEGSMQNGLILNGDDESDEDANSPYAQIGHWVEENRDALTAVEVYRKAQDMGIDKKHKTVQVLMQSIFTSQILSELKPFAPLFKKIVTSERHQKSLLGGLERFLGIDHPDLIPSLPKILMEFYQADVLEEEVLQQWGTHVSKKYVDKDTSKKVRKASEPFLKWLEEADDDDSDDNE